MKITHAVWEKRNMGVDAYEVKIEEGDEPSDFEAKRNEFESEYTVVKVSTSMPSFGFYLQECGYSYIETLLTLHRDVKLPELSRIQNRIISEMTYQKMSDEDIEFLFQEIRQGMFATDRVYIDPKFTAEQAANRYIGWIKDEKALGADIFNIIFKGKNVGFFMLREKENGVFYPALAGIYQSVTLPGIGVAMDYFQIVETARRGGKRLLGSVSTNNAAALTISMQLGYSIYRIEAVYAKHGELISI